MTYGATDLLGAPASPSIDGRNGGRVRSKSTRPSRLSRHDGYWFQGKLHPFQRTAVNFLMAHPNAVLADDVGLGKTITTLSYIARLEEAGRLDRKGNSECRVLWLTDPSLIEQTRAEVERFLPTHSVVAGGDWIFERDSQKARREWLTRFGKIGPDILILGYQDATTRMSGLLGTTDAGLVVLDDANRLTGVNTGKRYRSVSRLTERAERVVSITATPFWNDPMDLYRLLKATAAPGLWPQGVFERKFVTWRTPNVAGPGRALRLADTWTTPERIAEVRELLATCMIQRSALDVKVPMPARTGDNVRLVPLTPTQMHEYEQARQLTQGRDAVVKMSAAGRLVGYVSPMVDVLFEELRSRHGRQVIVYTEAPDMLGLVDEALTGWGESFVRVDGDMKPLVRARAIDEFREGHVRILLGSKVITRGLNLGNCDELITLDPSWTPAEEYQREGRMRQMDSPHRTYRHLALVPDHPLNHGKLHALDRKWAAARAVHLGRVEERPPWSITDDAQ